MNPTPLSREPLRVGIVAGENSGDLLGAGLIEALRQRVPNVSFFGVAGEHMIEAGCEAWYRSEELSVMGLAEVVRHLPRLLALRRDLRRRMEASRPHVFIGIDSPDFNVPLERRLRRAGIATVQYVSPQVWAWRQSRVATMREAADRVLCVLPFEADFYAKHDVNARFVGHPLADAIPLESDREAARAALAMEGDGPVLALLPGSRVSEVNRLGSHFLGAAGWVRQNRPDLRVVVALANSATAAAFAACAEHVPDAPPVTLIQGRTREVIAAADLVLTASGTATLETLLVNRPMVVAYRLAPLSYYIARRLGLGKLPHFSLPNLLAGRTVVPELKQGSVAARPLGMMLERVLRGEGIAADWYDVFSSIHHQLRCGASAAAAEAVLELILPSDVQS